MTKKKRRRPSRQRTSMKPMVSQIARGVVWIARFVYLLLEIWDKLSPSDISAFGLGFVVAFVSALLAVKTFILMLQRTSMAPFGIYRIIVAILFFLLMQNHPLQ